MPELRRRKTIKWLLIAKVWLVAVLLIWIAYRVYDPNRHIWGYTIYGIDVSRWQPSVDWAKAKRDGLTFVFIKATEGSDAVDPRFQEYWRQAGEHRWLKGAYHYFQPKSDPERQAKLFIENVPLEKGDLLPVVDVEEFPGKHRRRFQEHLQRLLNELEKHYHAKPIIYASHNYYVAFLKESFSEYPLWVANYNQRPGNGVEEELGREWDFWQYSNTGRVKGIQGNVDLDVFNGSYTELIEGYSLK